MARVFDAGAAFNEPKVHEIISMGKHPNDSDAKSMLNQVAKQVQPIMRKRGWHVPRLSEFFPANANLLGLNIGGGGGRTREIKVRLRPARDPLSFLPYDHILGTMLHELVHNVRGPHDSIFYKLLDELQTECEDLIARGVSGTGSGFDGPSAGRLGSHAFIPIHNPAPGCVRDAALRAAEDRAKKQRLMATGPQRLGGNAEAALALGPRQAAARAADRRRRDNTWCPCEKIGEALQAVRISRPAAAGALGTRRAKAASGSATGTQGVTQSGRCEAASATETGKALSGVALTAAAGGGPSGRGSASVLQPAQQRQVGGKLQQQQRLLAHDILCISDDEGEEAAAEALLVRAVEEGSEEADDIPEGQTGTAAGQKSSCDGERATRDAGLGKRPSGLRPVGDCSPSSPGHALAMRAGLVGWHVQAVASSPLTSVDEGVRTQRMPGGQRPGTSSTTRVSGAGAGARARTMDDARNVSGGSCLTNAALGTSVRAGPGGGRGVAGAEGVSSVSGGGAGAKMGADGIQLGLPAARAAAAREAAASGRVSAAAFVVDLTRSDGEEEQQLEHRRPGSRQRGAGDAASADAGMLRQPSSTGIVAGQLWACAGCTFVNAAAADVCDMCCAVRA